MNTQTQNDTETLANDTRLKDAIKLAGKLGGESVKSALAKPQLYAALCRGAADGYFTEDDVKPYFDAYLAGRTKVVNGNKIALGEKEDNANSFAANLSKLNNMFKLGMLTTAGIVDGPALLDKVIDRREYLFIGGRKVKATADAMLDVAKAQLKTPTTPLSDDAMDEVICRKEAEEKTLIKKLTDQYTKTYKLAEEMGDAMLDCTHIEASRDALADAIRALDGEVPVVGKKGKDKMDEEMVEFLISKKGMSKADAIAFVKR
jgi:hypothetical protein